MSADPKSTKRQSSHQYLFALLVYAGVKAARKTLVKSTPGETHCPSLRCQYLKERHGVVVMVHRNRVIRGPASEDEDECHRETKEELHFYVTTF